MGLTGIWFLEVFFILLLVVVYYVIRPALNLSAAVTGAVMAVVILLGVAVSIDSGLIQVPGAGAFQGAAVTVPEEALEISAPTPPQLSSEEFDYKSAGKASLDSALSSKE